MLKIGNLVPASYQSFGSAAPVLKHIWVSNANSNSNNYIVSTDGINWYKKGSNTSSSSMSSVPQMGFNSTTKEITQAQNASSTIYTYSIPNDSVSTHTVNSTPWGSSAPGMGHIIYDNTRNYWCAVSHSGSSTNGGTAAINTSAYLTTSGGRTLKKFQYNKAKYTICTSPSGRTFVFPLCTTNYCYLLAAGANFRTGTYTNKWSDMNTALTNAGVSNKTILGACYFPDKGFVFVVQGGVVVYDDINDTWTANSVSWGALNVTADQYSSSYYPNQMFYEPVRKRMYVAHCMNSGFMRVYYSDNGTSWSLLGSQTNTNMTQAGSSSNTKSIAADENCVIVRSYTTDYSLYKYSNNTWTLKSGLSFKDGETGFRNYSTVYCFYYTE